MSEPNVILTEDISYKNVPALKIETEKVSAVFLPDCGAKMASMLYKPLGREMLVQRPNVEFHRQPFDGVYVEGEVSGFDDMFPTIDRWIYDQYPWEGTVMSDHGEVWSLPWKAELESNKISLTVDGIRFPYQLSKRISFSNQETIRFDYQLLNRSSFDLNCIWAAHIMLNLSPGAELVLPKGPDQMYLTFDLGGRFGGYGKRYSLPEDRLSDGTHFDFTKLKF